MQSTAVTRARDPMFPHVQIVPNRKFGPLLTFGVDLDPTTVPRDDLTGTSD